MPIPIKRDPVKFSCRKCGWSIVRPSIRCGDSLSGAEARSLSGVSSCPSCKSKDISETPAIILPFTEGAVKKRWREFIGLRKPSSGGGILDSFLKDIF